MGYRCKGYRYFSKISPQRVKLSHLQPPHPPFSPQGSPGLVFAVAMTIFRRSALRRARALVVPDQRRYDAAWTRTLGHASAAAAVAAVDAAARRLEARCLSDAAEDFASREPGAFRVRPIPCPADLARQYARQRCPAGKTAAADDKGAGSSSSSSSMECGEPGTLDAGRAIDSLDQLYAQVRLLSSGCLRLSVFRPLFLSVTVIRSDCSFSGLVSISSVSVPPCLPLNIFFPPVFLTFVQRKAHSP